MDLFSRSNDESVAEKNHLLVKFPFRIWRILCHAGIFFFFLNGYTNGMTSSKPFYHLSCIFIYLLSTCELMLVFLFQPWSGDLWWIMDQYRWINSKSRGRVFPCQISKNISKTLLLAFWLSHHFWSAVIFSACLLSPRLIEVCSWLLYVNPEQFLWKSERAVYNKCLTFC